MDRPVSKSPIPDSLAAGVAPSPPVAPALFYERARRAIIKGLPQFSGYFSTVALSILLLFKGQHLDKADLYAPFLYNLDALLILPMVKSTVETGTHWKNARLGAPGQQELYDFPVVDHLHFAIIWLLGQILVDPVLTFNVFYLLTYPLTTLSAMYVLRHFGLSMPAAATGGILYAFQPYHYFRSVAHYFLSAYFMIPLTLMVALWVCRGTLPFFPETTAGSRHFRWRDGRGWSAVLIGIATASAGAYYAFFACAILAAASFYGWAACGTWRAAAAGWIMIFVIALAGVANHSPTFSHQTRTGYNSRPHLRYSEEAEIYGMKLAQLVLPVSNHKWQPFAAIHSEYDSNLRPLQNENSFDTLGLIGAVSLCALLICAFLPHPRRWPIGPLAALTLFAVLLGTIGGLGAIFNDLITPQVRAYNRISIYIAFLVLFAACWKIDQWISSRTGLIRRLRVPIFTGLVIFGLWDQLNIDWFPASGKIMMREEAAQQFRQDRQFFENVEESASPGAAVFNYPHIPYPESVPVGDVEAYDHVRGYLHTKTLRWSFGSMQNRQWDNRCRELMQEPPSQFFERLVLLGFDGLLVDNRGFTDKKKKQELLAGLEKYVGHVKLIRHPSGDLTYYDLSGYARQMRESWGKHTFEEMEQKEREQLAPMWLKGFFRADRTIYGRPEAQLVILNPSDRVRKVQIQTQLASLLPESSSLTITGPDWSDQLSLSEANQTYTRELELPPGHTKIWFHFVPPSSYLPNNSRNMVFLASKFHIKELPRSEPAAQP